VIQLKGNLCLEIKEGISLKSAVMAFIVDGDDDSLFKR
jgi:hypothetical protein